MAALIASASNQSLIFRPSQTKQLSTTLASKSKQPISKKCITKSLTLKTQAPTCKYGDSLNTHSKNGSVRTKSDSDSDSKSYSHIIWWSDVEVNRPYNLFSARKWESVDIEILSVFIMMHLLAVFGASTFNWGAFWVFAALVLVTGLFGITLSYHRNLTHRSFSLPKWLEYTFAYCGVFALQKDPIFWVSAHRYHHQYTDSEQDPHSPLEGFWFSHIIWLLDAKAIIRKCGEPSNVKDLEKQPFYKFIRSTYWLHPLLLGLLLYASGGFPYLVWGMGVRVTFMHHMTFFVNSVCHIWGNQTWNTGDLSKNNWWVALMSFGEGWHNNHHAFEYSAKHGLEWWQIDMTWYTIKLLQFLGLAKDVKLPTKDHKQRLAFDDEAVAI